MLKFLFRLVLLFIVLCVLLFFFAPTLLSTEWGKTSFLSLFNKLYKKSLHIDHLKLSWLHGQELSGVTFKDPENNLFLHLDTVSITGSLKEILLSHALGEVVINHPHVELTTAFYKNVSWSTPSPSTLKLQAGFIPSFTLSSPYTAAVQLREGEVVLKDAGIKLNHLFVDVEIKESEPFLIKASGDTAFPEKGSFNLAGTFLNLENIDLKAHFTDFPVALLDPFLKGKASALIGERLDSTVNIKKNDTQLDLSIEIESLYLSGKMETQTKGSTVSLKTPALFTWHLSPQGVEKLTGMLPKKEVEVTLSLSELLYVLNPEEGKESTFLAHLSSSEIALEETTLQPVKVEIACSSLEKGSYTASIHSAALLEPAQLSLNVPAWDNISLSIKAKEGDLCMQAAFDPKTTLFSLTAPLTFHYTLFLPQLKTPALLKGDIPPFSCTLKKIPPFKVNLEIPEFALENVPMQHVQATLNISAGEKELTLSHFVTHCTLSSPTLKGTFVLERKEDRLSLLQPAQLEWTPSIENPQENLSLKISRFSSPLPLQLSSLTMALTASADHLNYQFSPSLPPASVRNLKLDVLKSDPDQPLSFSCNAALGGKGSVDASGTLDYNTASLEFTSTLHHVPTTFLDLYMPSLSGILGEELEGSLSAKISDWSGPVELRLQTPHFLTTLKGEVSKGMLTLKESARAQLAVSPALSAWFLKNRDTLGIKSIRTEAPLSLEIPPSGVEIPLKEKTYQNWKIPHAHLEIGKILCENSGELSSLFKLLKLSQFSKKKFLTVWFAPAFCSLQNGILTAERTEILVENDYQICNWGKIDLLKKKINMVLGLTAPCLEQAFKIKNLPENYVLHIPIQGSLEDVHINTPAATAKIAALLLWQQKTAAGDKAPGGFFGKLVDTLGALPDADAKTPPPHTPFPWERDQPSPAAQAEEDTTPTKKKKHFKPDDKPLKQILKFIR